MATYIVCIAACIIKNVAHVKYTSAGMIIPCSLLQCIATATCSKETHKGKQSDSFNYINTIQYQPKIKQEP